MPRDTFSRRSGYSSPPEITIREAAPEWLREAVVELALDRGIDPGTVDYITRELWPPESFGAVNPMKCDWHGIYDLAEAFYTEIHEMFAQPGPEAKYEEQLNEYFEERGVGWQMRNGKIEARGSEPFETATRGAGGTLAEAGRQTAAREIHEALQDLSRRPEPDLTGAIRHAMAALECVARDVSGQNSATLGKVLNDSAAAMGIQPPLGAALEKLWGYASDRARHLREGESPRFEEAELVVTIASAVSVYLTKKAKVPGD